MNNYENINIFNAWGKRNECQITQTVYEHSVLTVWTMDILMDMYVIQTIRKKFPVWYRTFAATHDVGKISPGFQSRHIEFFKKYFESQDLSNKQKYHNFISGSSIDNYLIKENKTTLTFAENIGRSIMSHHGFFDPYLNENHISYDLGNNKHFQKERYNFIKLMESKFGKIVEENIDPFILRLMTGLLICSDWLASSYEEIHPDVDNEQEIKNKLIDHIKNNQKIIDCIINPLIEMKDIIGYEKANDLQNAAKKAAKYIEEGSVIIIEGIMGSGKTEASFIMSYEENKKYKKNGIFLGMPTRITSNNIKERFDKYISKICDTCKESKLIHSTSFLYVSKNTIEDNDFYDSNKKSLLHPFSVGTIDQFLLSVTHSKHADYKKVAFMNKTIIIDEVHTYDHATGTLLIEAINTLKEVGCTFILLSATLSDYFKQKLLGISENPNKKKFTPNNYPLITVKNNKDILLFKVKKPRDKKIHHSFIRSSPEESIPTIYKKLKKGQNVAVIFNTVKRSQSFYRKFLKYLSLNPNEFISVQLLHSKYTNGDRSQIEKEVLDKLSKGKIEKNITKFSLVIATQVIEQSVDVDFDCLYTDLCPIDFLLQRIGRLWRFKKKRICNKPECYIFVPKSIDCKTKTEWETIKKDDGWNGIYRYVYKAYYLFRTYYILNSMKYILLPKNLRTIINTVYDGDEEFKNWHKELLIEIIKNKNSIENLSKLKMSLNNPPEKKENIICMTRNIGIVSIPVLLIKDIISFTDDEISFTTNDNINIDINKKDKPNKYLQQTIMKNIITLPFYHINSEEDIDCEDYNDIMKKQTLTKIHIAKVNDDLSLSFINGKNFGINNKKYFYIKNIGFTD